MGSMRDWQKMLMRLAVVPALENVTEVDLSCWVTIFHNVNLNKPL